MQNKSSSRLIFQKKLTKINRSWNIIESQRSAPSIEIKLEPSELSTEEVLVENAVESSSEVSKANEMIVYLCKACNTCFPYRRMLEEHNATVHMVAAHKEIVPSESDILKEEVAVQVGDRTLFNGYFKDKNDEFGCMYCSFRAMDRPRIYVHVTNKHSSLMKLNSESGEDLDESKSDEEGFQTKIEIIGEADEDDEEFWPIEVVEETLEEDVEEVQSFEVEKKLLVEEYMEGGKIRKCPQCPFQSNKASTYYSHIKRKHHEYWLKSLAEKEAAHKPPEDAVELSCPQCPYKSYKRTTMRMHLKRKHMDPPKKKKKVDEDGKENQEDEEGEDENMVLQDDGDSDDSDSESPSRKKSMARKSGKCPYCPFESWIKSTLQSHIVRLHGKGKSRSSDKKEGNVQMYTGYACHYCTFVAATVNSINHHNSREHSGQKQPLKEVPVTEYDCDQCEYKSKKRKKMQMHLKTCHNVEANTDGMFSCNICSYETHSKMGLARHISIKHNKARREGISTFGNNVVFACDQCEFQSQNKKTMDWHRRQHTAPANDEDNGGTYSCNDCNFSTWTKGQLYLHIKRKHKGVESQEGVGGTDVQKRQEQIISCDQCDYTCKSKHVMKVHVIRKHTEDYNHECEICGKKYKVKADLTNHIRFQHREQPIICDVCGKTCRNSNLLYLHQKFAHYKTEFECHICHRRLASQANLDDHIVKQHERKENVVCDECGKSFSKIARLKIHKRVHTGVKPYSCKICMKAFARRNGLRQHLLIHSGQRPYICDICGKNFTQKTGLISHRKSHPGLHPPLPRVTIDHVLNDLLNEEEEEV